MRIKIYITIYYKQNLSKRTIKSVRKQKIYDEYDLIFLVWYDLRNNAAILHAMANKMHAKFSNVVGVQIIKSPCRLTMEIELTLWLYPEGLICILFYCIVVCVLIFKCIGIYLFSESGCFCCFFLVCCCW